jgi:hypothetical protein
MPQVKTPLTIFGADRLITNEFLEDFFETHSEFTPFNHASKYEIILAVLADTDNIHSGARSPGSARLRRLFCNLVSEASEFVVRFSNYVLDRWQGMTPIEKFLIWTPIIIKSSGK